MAHGDGSKRSLSCDQEVVPYPLNSGVSNCTAPLLESFSLVQRSLLAFCSLFV